MDLDFSRKATILIVDDTPDNLALMHGLLKGRLPDQGRQRRGRRRLPSPFPTKRPTLSLDLMMPDMDGYEVCRQLRAAPATREIPVIFLTARSDVEAERKGLDLGANDYITKPIQSAHRRRPGQNHLALKAMPIFSTTRPTTLSRGGSPGVRKDDDDQEVHHLAMAALAEIRDCDTGNHIRRTQFYVKALAESLRHHPRFAGQLNDQQITMLFKSAPLHDIGKVGIRTTSC